MSSVGFFVHDRVHQRFNDIDPTSLFIERCIYTTTLHNSIQIEISLAVANEVYFFDAQFLIIWRKNKRNTFLSTSPQSSPVSFLSKGLTLDQLNSLSANTLAENLGIEFTEIGDDFLTAKMPVDKRTHQPLGMLHGGASVALAETLGSVAAFCCIDIRQQYCVGLDINANHIKGVKSGFVFGTTKAVHVGKKTHVWEIRIVNEQNELVCISRITMAVIDKK